MASFLPKDYGYVILSGAVGGLALNIYLASRVSRARKEHGVKVSRIYSKNMTLYYASDRRVVLCFTVIWFGVFERQYYKSLVHFPEFRI